MVVLEAFREATPIVARRLGPFPDIIEESGGGLLFGTSEELGAAVDSLMRDARLRDKLGTAALQAYEARWSENVAMSEYFGVIRRLAERRGDKELVARLTGRRQVSPRTLSDS